MDYLKCAILFKYKNFIAMMSISPIYIISTLIILSIIYYIVENDKEESSEEIRELLKQLDRRYLQSDPQEINLIELQNNISDKLLHSHNEVMTEMLDQHERRMINLINNIIDTLKKNQRVNIHNEYTIEDYEKDINGQ